MLTKRIFIFIDEFSYDFGPLNLKFWGPRGQSLNVIRPKAYKRHSFCLAISIFGVILIEVITDTYNSERFL